MIWIFDEVIGKNTDFEGNNLYNAKKELLAIISEIIINSFYYDEINIEILQEFLKMMCLLNINLDDDKDIKINENGIGYYLCGWYKHAILIFYEKIYDNYYTVGIINAGEGSNIQGIQNDLCNGIMLFNNINSYLPLAALAA